MIELGDPLLYVAAVAFGSTVAILADLTHRELTSRRRSEVVRE